MDEQSGLPFETDHNLSNDDVCRYSRQIILADVGVECQEQVRRGAVLIVGCGGLGCPAAQYLAASGIGRLGLVDDDVVEVTNLHRQTLHREDNVGGLKSLSIADFVKGLNSSVCVTCHNVRLDSSNAEAILAEYDIIIDATDNVAARYLVSDVCVRLDKPLVSGSALGWEGQLTVYNYKNGPTYRCLFPTPPSAHLTGNCSDNGVMGPVPGVIGVLQANEAIKLLMSRAKEMPVLSGRMLIFDGLHMIFRVVKLRARQVSSEPGAIDFDVICRRGCRPEAEVCDDRRVKVSDVSGWIHRLFRTDVSGQAETVESLLVVDVRPESQFNIGSLKGYIKQDEASFTRFRVMNIPMADLRRAQSSAVDRIADELNEMASSNNSSGSVQIVCFVCRRGVSSLQALHMIRPLFSSRRMDSTQMSVRLTDMEGGITAWHHQIDNRMPLY